MIRWQRFQFQHMDTYADHGGIVVAVIAAATVIVILDAIAGTQMVNTILDRITPR